MRTLKKIVPFMLAFALVFAMTACTGNNTSSVASDVASSESESVSEASEESSESASEESSESSEEESAVTVDADLAAVAAATGFDAMSAENASVTTSIVYEDASAGEFSTEAIVSSNENGLVSYTSDSNGYGQYFANGMLYYLDKNVENNAVQVFVGDQAAQYAAKCNRVIAIPTDVGTVISSDVSAGSVTTVVEMTSDEAAAWFAENVDYGFDLSPYTTLRFTIVYSNEASVLSQMTVQGVTDAEEVILYTVNVTGSADALAVPEYVTTMMAAETRNITLHYGDDTVTAAIPANAQLAVNVPEGYTMYSDAEGEVRTEDTSTGDVEVWLLQ